MTVSSPVNFKIIQTNSNRNKSVPLRKTFQMVLKWPKKSKQFIVTPISSVIKVITVVKSSKLSELLNELAVEKGKMI